MELCFDSKEQTINFRFASLKSPVYRQPEKLEEQREEDAHRVPEQGKNTSDGEIQNYANFMLIKLDMLFIPDEKL